MDILRKFRNGIILITFLLMACFTSADATIYYSISTGSWDDVSNWSLTGFGGAAAGAYPVTNDTAYIQGVEIRVDHANITCKYVIIYGSGSSDGKLEIWNSYSLTVSGDMLLDADNGNFEAHLHLKENIISQGGGILLVQGNVLAYRNGGTAHVEIEIDDDAVMTVNGDMTLDFDGGSEEIDVDVEDDGQLFVKGDLTLDFSGGTDHIDVDLSNNAILDVDGDIYFISNADDKTEICVHDNTFLYLAGDFIRQSAPNNYGILNASENGTVVYNGSSIQVFAEDAGAGTDNFTYQNVTINNTYGTSPQLTLEGDATVNGTLTMTDGVVKVGAEDLIIGTSGTTAGGSINSYVDVTSANGGKNVKVFDDNSAINFLVGDDDEYAPFTFTKNNSSGGDATITIDMTDATHPNIEPGDMISRYWTINASGLSSIDYDVSYIYNEVDVSGTEADMSAARWNGTRWTQYNDVNDATNTLSSSSGITQMPTTHDFSAGDGWALPIELLSIDATVKGRRVEITWTTAMEINNDYFTIERSGSGINFEAIAEVQGMGTSYSESTYSYFDDNAPTGTCYYRLKQTDDDGSFEYFDPIAVQISILNSTMKMYPNPLSTDEHLTLELSGQEANEEVLVVLYNNLGQRVFSKVLITESNGVLTGIDLMNNVTPGVYLIVASSRNVLYHKNLVITNRGRSNNMVRK